MPNIIVKNIIFIFIIIKTIPEPYGIYAERERGGGGLRDRGWMCKGTEAREGEGAREERHGK